MSVYRPIIYGNSTVWMEEAERPPGSDHTHRWTVGVRSAAALPPNGRGPADQIGGADDLRCGARRAVFGREQSLTGLWAVQLFHQKGHLQAARLLPTTLAKYVSRFRARTEEHTS